MYSLVIAEDEFINRRNLVEKVPWNEFGFQVDAEFADGSEVLEYLKDNTPDVILTDIKLISVDGTEVARFVAQHKLPTKVVFLSGYRDFSLAQEAVEYQVVHYIVKPVVLYKLKEVFLSLREKMDEQRLKEQHLSEAYREIVNYEKQQFVLDAYFGALHEGDKMQKRLSILGDAARNARLHFVKVLIQNDQSYKEFLENYGEKEIQDQLINVMNLLDKNQEFFLISWRSIEGENPFVLGILWEKEKTSNIVMTQEEMQQAIQMWLPVTVTIPVLHTMSSPEELVYCEEEFCSSQTIDEVINDANYSSVIKEQNIMISTYLVQNDRENALDITGSLVHNFLRGGIVFAQQQCVYTVIKLLEEIKAADVMAWNKLYMACVTPNIFTMTDFVSMHAWLVERITLVFDYMDQKSEGRKDARIKSIMNYLQQHYAEDISLNTLAENVYLNASYVSRLLKEQTGKNFTEIIAELRIKKAEELLENSDMHIYEIAEEVGFNNVNYFYKSFKKFRNAMPGDYRKRK